MNYFKIRDDLHSSPETWDKVISVGETMRVAFGLPYDEYMSDSLESKNASVLDERLDRLASLINKKLTNEVKIRDDDRFLLHHGVKLTINKKREVFAPYVLALSDHQTITALSKNVKPKDVFNERSEVKVVAWAINNKDVTDMMGDIDSMTDAEISTVLATFINRLHNVFIKKNPPKVDDREVLLQKINDVEIDTSNVVWIVPTDPTIPIFEKLDKKATIDTLIVALRALIRVEDSIPNMENTIDKVNEVYESLPSM